MKKAKSHCSAYSDPLGILGDPGAVSGGGKKSKRARKKFLTFLRPNFFLARLDIFPPPLTAPGSPSMPSRQSGQDSWGCP